LYEVLVDELHDAFYNGFPVWDSSTNEIFHFRLIVHGVLMDLKGHEDALAHMATGTFLACMKCNLVGTKGTHGEVTKRNGEVEWGYIDGPLGKVIYSGRMAKRRRETARCYTKEEVHRIWTMHDEMASDASLTKAARERSFKQHGWKTSSPFARLEYLDVTRDFWWDLMHGAQNLGRHVHGALQGDDFHDKYRKQAEQWEEKEELWMDKTVVSPCAIPDKQIPREGRESQEQIQKGKLVTCKARGIATKWAQGGLRIPRSWGSMTNALMRSTKMGKARAFKAHQSVVALTSGILSTLAAHPGASSEEDERRKRFARIVGDITQVMRELTASFVMVAHIQKLRDLVTRVWGDMDKECSYDFMVINTHMFLHMVDQLERNGPVREWWMFAFESAFGVNKMITKNKQHIVGSMMLGIGRRLMLEKVMAFRSLVPGLAPAPIETPIIVPNRRELELFGKGSLRDLTNEEQELLLKWLKANYPTYWKIRSLYEVHLKSLSR